MVLLCCVIERILAKSLFCQKVSESAFDMAMDIDILYATEGIQYRPSKDMGSMQTFSARAIDYVVR